MTFAGKLNFFIICALIVLMTLAYGGVHHPILAIFYAITAIIVILWSIDSLISGEFRINKNLIQIPLLLTIIYGVFQIIPFGSLAETVGVSDISKTISFEPFATKLATINFIALTIFLSVLLILLDSTNRLKNIVSFITIFGAIYAFFAIIQGVLSPTKVYGIYELKNATPFGSFINRHNFAAFMEMTIAIPLGLVFVGAIGKDKRLLYFTAIGLMGVAMVLSGSRGGLVSLLALVIFLVIAATENKSTAQIGLKIVLAVVLVATIIFGASLVGGESSFTRFAETAVSKNVTSDRTQIWQITIDVIKNNLPFGVGLGAYGTAYTQFDTTSGMERVEQAHNDYLQVLADAGIIGLLIGLFFVFQLFRTGWKNLKTHDKFKRGVVVGAMSGCFAIFVHSLFDFVLHTTAVSLMFLVLVALIVVCEKKENEEHQEKRKVRTADNIASIEDARKKITA
ncbi:MAG: O-antigen ligase family protein [Pyrinomonadaceae bacterium]|jgi:O-antigen ligase|nr:O-antigen ligase family protein [Pyrinomonadaceae bacterium]